MKTLKTLIASLLVLMVLAVPSFAQTTTTLTNLSTALTDTNNNQVVVLSATGITASTVSAQTFIYIDQELMRVRAISGTTLTVARAVNALASAHLANAPVYFGTPGNWSNLTGNSQGVFITKDPVGRCTRASNQFLPVINPATGSISDCIIQPSATTGVTTAGTTHQWTSTNFAVVRGGIEPFKMLRPEQTTYTLLPTDSILFYNTSAAGTITIPAVTGLYGKKYVIQIAITGTQSVTVATSAAQTVNGLASVIFGGRVTGSALDTTFQQLILHYDGGSRWFAAVAP